MKIAIVGAGTLGRGWAISFARAGCEVRLFDEAPGAVSGALRSLDERLPALARHGLVEDAGQTRALVQPASDLAEALDGVDFVQESIPEILDLKRSLFERLDSLAPATAVLASSTSGLPPSAFVGDLAGRERCLAVHPLNPPYLNPAVEIVRSPWTSDAAASRAASIMQAIGQVPIMTRGEGRLILTRLQGALLDEAFRLVAEGSATAEEVDKAVRDGIGLRYAFMGPFETMDLNAPQGIADFVRRYGRMFTAIRRERDADAADWPEELVSKVDADRRAILPLEDLQERMAWRDERLTEIAAYKRSLADR